MFSKHPSSMRLAGILLIVCTMVSLGCGRTQSYERPTVDTTDTRASRLPTLLEDNSNLSYFARAVDVSGYGDLIDGAGPLTVLAPHNEAFLRSIPRDSVTGRALRDSLADVVGLHIIRGDLREIHRDSLTISTLANEELVIRRRGSDLLIQGVPVIDRIIAQNGVLYVISRPVAPAPPDTTVRPLDRRLLRVET